jgi:hypothetical protein
MEIDESAFCNFYTIDGTVIHLVGGSPVHNDPPVILIAGSCRFSPGLVDGKK